MQQIEPSESLVIQGQNNQFLGQMMEYQSCPFCSRSFFRGKLAYHLKLCSLDNPMTKTQKPNKQHKKNVLSAVNSYDRCGICKTRMPSYLVKKHEENCNKSISRPYFKESASTPRQKIQKTNETLFPKIRKAGSGQTKQQFLPKLQLEPIKIRQQLRCFRKAEEVQKVTCQSCGRKFSEQASLRHIPVCQQLRKKQNSQCKMRKTKHDNSLLKMKNTKKHAKVKQSQFSTRSFIQDEKSNKDITMEILSPEEVPLQIKEEQNQLGESQKLQ